MAEGFQKIAPFSSQQRMSFAEAQQRQKQQRLQRYEEKVRPQRIFSSVKQQVPSNYIIKRTDGKIIVKAPEKEYAVSTWLPTGSSTTNKYIPEERIYDSEGRLREVIIRDIGTNYSSSGRTQFQRTYIKSKKVYDEAGNIVGGFENVFRRGESGTSVDKVKVYSKGQVVTQEPLPMGRTIEAPRLPTQDSDLSAENRAIRERMIREGRYDAQIQQRFTSGQPVSIEDLESAEGQRFVEIKREQQVASLESLAEPERIDVRFSPAAFARAEQVLVSDSDQLVPPTPDSEIRRRIRIITEPTEVQRLRGEQPSINLDIYKDQETQETKEREQFLEKFGEGIGPTIERAEFAERDIEKQRADFLAKFGEGIGPTIERSRAAKKPGITQAIYETGPLSEFTYARGGPIGATKYRRPTKLESYLKPLKETFIGEKFVESLGIVKAAAYDYPRTAVGNFIRQTGFDDYLVSRAEFERDLFTGQKLQAYVQKDYTLKYQNYIPEFKKTTERLQKYDTTFFKPSRIPATAERLIDFAGIASGVNVGITKEIKRKPERVYDEIMLGIAAGGIGRTVTSGYRWLGGTSFFGRTFTKGTSIGVGTVLTGVFAAPIITKTVLAPKGQRAETFGKEITPALFYGVGAFGIGRRTGIDFDIRQPRGTKFKYEVDNLYSGKGRTIWTPKPTKTIGTTGEISFDLAPTIRTNLPLSTQARIIGKTVLLSPLFLTGSTAIIKGSKRRISKAELRQRKRERLDKSFIVKGGQFKVIPEQFKVRGKKTAKLFKVIEAPKTIETAVKGGIEPKRLESGKKIFAPEVFVPGKRVTPELPSYVDYTKQPTVSKPLTGKTKRQFRSKKKGLQAVYELESRGTVIERRQVSQKEIARILKYEQPPKVRLANLGDVLDKKIKPIPLLKRKIVLLSQGGKNIKLGNIPARFDDLVSRTGDLSVSVKQQRQFELKRKVKISPFVEPKKTKLPVNRKDIFAGDVLYKRVLPPAPLKPSASDVVTSDFFTEEVSGPRPKTFGGFRKGQKSKLFERLYRQRENIYRQRGQFVLVGGPKPTFYSPVLVKTFQPPVLGGERGLTSLGGDFGLSTFTRTGGLTFYDRKTGIAGRTDTVAKPKTKDRFGDRIINYFLPGTDDDIIERTRIRPFTSIKPNIISGIDIGRKIKPVTAQANLLDQLTKQEIPSINRLITTTTNPTRKRTTKTVPIRPPRLPPKPIIPRRPFKPKRPIKEPPEKITKPELPPPPPPNFFLLDRQTTGKKKKKKRRTIFGQYNPSLGAIGEKVYGKQPGILTGIKIRPIAR